MKVNLINAHLALDVCLQKMNGSESLIPLSWSMLMFSSMVVMPLGCKMSFSLVGLSSSDSIVITC